MSSDIMAKSKIAIPETEIDETQSVIVKALNITAKLIERNYTYLIKVLYNLLKSVLRTLVDFRKWYTHIIVITL